MNSSAQHIAENVRPWLDLIDTFRMQGVHRDLPLPQIAVMGDQSSGKSSVLEAISGIPFPRGSGLVTRCATQLTMKSAPPGTPFHAHVAVSWNRPQPRECGDVSSPEELAERIEQLTDILTEKSPNAFSTDTIVVRVESEGSPDLTVIDLPGIIRTATAGQSPEVIRSVNSLIERYLEEERTIILAVVPANQDVATIDILERANQVDPTGARTLGVLTKADLIGPGSEPEVLETLRNVRKPLTLGYVMVKCRSQRDLENGVPPTQARQDEAKFFSEHPDWSQVRPGLLGIGNLTSRLTDLLVERIKLALPVLKWELQMQLENVDRELRPLGKKGPQTTQEMRTYFMKLVSNYCSLLRQSARGFYGDALLAESSDLRLFGVCQEHFMTLKESVVASRPGFNDPRFNEQLAKDMKGLRGRELSGFHNSQAFYNFVAQNVEAWRPAVQDCCLKVVGAARNVCSELIHRLAPSYPDLATLIFEASVQIITDMAESTQRKLEAVFVKESDPFTTNENMLELINQARFKNFDQALTATLAVVSKTESIDDLQKEIIQNLGAWYMQYHGVNITSRVEDLSIMIEAYWDVATKRLVDNVCMTMEHDFINVVVRDVESQCFLIATSMGTDEEELSQLFAEDPEMVRRRQVLIEKQERTVAALATLRKMAPNVVAERPY